MIDSNIEVELEKDLKPVIVFACKKALQLPFFLFFFSFSFSLFLKLLFTTRVAHDTACPWYPAFTAPKKAQETGKQVRQ